MQRNDLIQTHKAVARLEKASIRLSTMSMPEPNTGCYLWFGANAHGYGLIRVNGALISTHRLSYLLFVGDIPDGLVVRHRCDQPACINPDHLLIGTHTDNAMDAYRRGRRRAHDRSKLTAEQRSAICEARRSGAVSTKALAKAYGVTTQTISRTLKKFGPH